MSKNRSNYSSILFKGLQVLVWLIFIGLCLDAGDLILNFLFSVLKPEWVQHAHRGLDLTPLYRDNSFFFFFGVSSLLVVVAVLKAWLFYILIRFMLKLDLSKPFSDFAVRRIMEMSYFALAIGVLSFIGFQFCKHHDDVLNNLGRYWANREGFILMGLVIHVIGTVFKTGVAIQNENKLTI